MATDATWDNTRISRWDLGLDPSVNIRYIYLPLIVQRSLSSSADLIVTGFGLGSLNPASGQPVVVQFTVHNRGGGDAGPFWVDLYVNPDPLPTRANQVWSEVCTRPCIGLAWPVDGLRAGHSLVLDSAGGYSRPHSVWPGSLPAGTHDLYVYADTWNPGVTGGAVAESDETNNRAGLLGVVVGGSGPAEEGSWPPVDLPDRPLLPGE